MDSITLNEAKEMFASHPEDVVTRAWERANKDKVKPSKRTEKPEIRDTEAPGE